MKKDISEKEMKLVKNLIKANQEKDLYSLEEDLMEQPRESEENRKKGKKKKFKF